MRLQIILGSTRPNRVSPVVAAWVAQTAAVLPDTTAEIVDLAEYELPFFDEPVSPRYNPNRQPSQPVSRWLDKLAAADAYVFVTPEYNHSVPAVLKNALDYVTVELSRKPATVVSHGTVGGARAAMHLKEILIESQAVVIPFQVALVGGVGANFDSSGQLNEAARANPMGPAYALDRSLSELKWYSDALAAARAAAA